MITQKLGPLKEILDCPICCQVDKVYLRMDDDGNYSVGCSRCEIDTYSYHALDQATEKWIQLGVKRFYQSGKVANGK